MRSRLTTFFCGALLLLGILGCSSQSSPPPQRPSSAKQNDLSASPVPGQAETKLPSTPELTETKAESTKPSVFPDRPTELTLYSLDFRDEESPSEPKNDGKERFINYLVIGKTVREPAEGAKCFDPRHGLRIVAENGTTEVVICFACSQYHSTGAQQSDGYELISSMPEPMLNGILKDAKIEILPGMEELMRERLKGRQL